MRIENCLWPFPKVHPFPTLIITSIKQVYQILRRSLNIIVVATIQIIGILLYRVDITTSFLKVGSLITKVVVTTKILRVTCSRIRTISYKEGFFIGFVVGLSPQILYIIIKLTSILGCILNHVFGNLLSTLPIADTILFQIIVTSALCIYTGK